MVHRQDVVVERDGGSSAGTLVDGQVHVGCASEGDDSLEHVIVDVVADAGENQQGPLIAARPLGPGPVEPAVEYFVDGGEGCLYVAWVGADDRPAGGEDRGPGGVGDSAAGGALDQQAFPSGRAGVGDDCLNTAGVPSS